MAPYSPRAIEMGEIVVCRDTSEGLRKGRLLSSFHCFLFIYFFLQAEGGAMKFRLRGGVGCTPRFLTAQLHWSE